ncbi:CYTH domain-containing protein [Microbacterium sp. R86528]|uniref:CYTH domain-containing protein n=1 Tax=Microbacterium sp. R86528 TaxID=3093864 RepID=UPI0037C9F3D0
MTALTHTGVIAVFTRTMPTHGRCPYAAAGRVRKHRVAFIAGRTRIHLDRVEDLGDFIELEVAIDDPADIDGATSEAQSIMATLGIESSQLVSTAYVDLAKDSR